MAEPVRISPEVARQKVLSHAAILVCAYEEEEKFRKMHLEGAISLKEFKNRASSLPKEQEIIFY
jgi:rhodanese-related sulfurtransferase